MRCSRRILLALSCAASLDWLPLWAQSPRPRLKGDGDRKIDTRVTIDLISADGAGFAAQEWATIFQDLNVGFSVRRSQLDEKPETTETTSGVTIRDVQVLGRLERDGSITFADRKFRTGDVAKIRDWIDGLKAYGAQGSPTGQPMWGLSKGQFDPLFEALTPGLKTEPQGLALNKALDLLTARQAFPLRFTADATQLLEAGSVPEKVERAYGGISEGASLAGILNEFGLGFHPQRTAKSKIELAVVPLKPKAVVWPVGWPLVEDPPKVAPGLFKQGDVELTDEPLEDVLLAVADLIEVPVLFDTHGLKSDGINLKTKKVSHKKKRTLWSAALKHVCFQARCKWELRMDEAGHPLLWVMSDIPPKDPRDSR